MGTLQPRGQICTVYSNLGIAIDDSDAAASSAFHSEVTKLSWPVPAIDALLPLDCLIDSVDFQADEDGAEDLLSVALHVRLHAGNDCWTDLQGELLVLCD
ncbi:hypothetical protein KC342_g14 [Hortaea werneckii]|nr:hypothetical protein KC342_g14 [Hortaea werneckii]